MSWQDRKKIAKFITGDKKEYIFEFESIESSREDRVNVFTFTESSGDFVQKLSNGGNNFNFTFWFSGEDHDQTANDFEDSTKDVRPIELYTPFRSIPYKCIIISLSRVDDLVGNANLTAFNVEMHETIELYRPESLENSIEIINNLSLSASNNASNEYLNTINSKVTNQTGIGLQETTVPFSTTDSIQPIPSTKNELRNIVNKIDSKINELFTDAEDFLTEAQTTRFSALDLISNLENKSKSAALVIRGYIGLVSNTQNDLDKLNPEAKVNFYKEIKDFAYELVDITNFELLVPEVIIGTCKSTVVATPDDFNTRRELFEINDLIYDWTYEFFAKIDSVISTDELKTFEPNIDSLKELASIVSITTSKVDELVLELKQERTFTINRHFDLYSLAYKLFGALSINELQDHVKNLIKTNKLKGSSVFQLLPGDSVVYYL